MEDKVKRIVKEELGELEDTVIEYLTSMALSIEDSNEFKEAFVEILRRSNIIFIDLFYFILLIFINFF